MLEIYVTFLRITRGEETVLKKQALKCWRISYVWGSIFRYL